MEPSEATLARERCSQHPDRAAVGRCERCGRTTCLECAVPFRGAIRCERCAALELGQPEPEPADARRVPWLQLARVAVLLVGIGSTIPPWHRSGTLTTPLSAWRFPLDGWAALGCVLLAAALILALAAVLRPARTAGAAELILPALAAASMGVALARAPAFFSSTTAPLVALSAAVAAAALSAFRLVRRARP